MTTARPSRTRAIAAICAAMVWWVAAGCESKPPETPGAPQPGNCCMRNAEPADQVCGAQAECCRDLERDDCEAKKGIWFHSLEGCRGAC